MTPAAVRMGALPTRTQVMEPELPVWRSRMSSLAMPPSTTSLSSARYFPACAAQGSLGLKSSRPTSVAGVRPASSRSGR